MANSVATCHPQPQSRASLPPPQSSPTSVSSTPTQKPLPPSLTLEYPSRSPSPTPKSPPSLPSSLPTTSSLPSSPHPSAPAPTSPASSLAMRSSRAGTSPSSSPSSQPWNVFTPPSSHSLDNRVQISTPHSLGILSDSNPSSPPSGARFQSGYDTHVIGPMLRFLRVTRSPFVVNPYPFFGTEEWNLGFALFRNDTHGVFDGISGKNYSNMFDAQMDAVFSAMKDVGFEEVEILVGETGWPSSGDPGVVGADLDSAQEYNRKLIQHVRSGSGTPLMPNRTFEVYLFALFDEDLKPGPTTERHFGLFKQDFSPVYDAGVVSRPPESLAPASVSPSAVDGLRCDWHWAILIWVLCALVC